MYCSACRSLWLLSFLTKFWLNNKHQNVRDVYVKLQTEDDRSANRLAFVLSTSEGIRTQPLSPKSLKLIIINNILALKSRLE